MRIEPAPSVAWAAARQAGRHRGARCRRSSRRRVRSVSHGLRVTPQVGDSVAPMIASSGRLVLPRITAPAARSRRTSSESAVARVA